MFTADFSIKLLDNSHIYNEKELLSHVAKGNEAAFRQLFEQYWDNVYGVAYAMTKEHAIAKDIVQEVFIKVWKLRETLVEKADFRSFLFIVARNHIFNELRRRKRQDNLVDRLEAYFEERSASAEEKLLYKESTALIEAAIAELSPQQKEVYLLSREKGWKRQDIADHLRVSIPTVKTHLSRALEHIREYLERHSGNPLLLFLSLIRALL